MSPSDGSELGDTVDAVLQPTGEFPISGPVDWQLISGSQYPIIGRTASPDPDGTFRLTGADISDVPAGPANLIAYFSWTDGLGRSEEHTSELQSLMRISYAVFCLKKKNITLLTTCTPTNDI